MDTHAKGIGMPVTMFATEAPTPRPIGTLRISVGQQGPEELRVAAGRLIKGVGIASIDVCNMAPVQRGIDSGIIYSELRKLGVSPIAATQAAPILDHSAATTLTQTIVDISSAAAGDVGLAGAVKAIHMGNGLAIALMAVPGVLALAQTIFNRRLPNPKPTEDAILKGAYTLNPGQCIPSSVFLYRYNGKWPGGDSKEVYIP
jgi:hypothetical protein